MSGDVIIISLLIIILLGGILVLVRLSPMRKASSVKTSTALANQLLRHPERILIDVPLYSSATKDMNSYDFILRAEAELASIGELESRRQFLIHFAELVKSPSSNSLKELTSFLFQKAPVIFLDALRWDGRCSEALRFLEFTHRLIKFIETGKSLANFKMPSKKGRKRYPKEFPNELQDMDAKIMQEWNEMNKGILRTINVVNKKGYRKKINQNDHMHSELLRVTEESKVPHLLPLLFATRDVFNQFL